MFRFTVKDTVLPPFKRIFISVVLHFSIFRFSADRRVDKYGVRLGLLILQRKLKNSNESTNQMRQFLRFITCRLLQELRNDSQTQLIYVVQGAAEKPDSF